MSLESCNSLVGEEYQAVRFVVHVRNREKF